MRIRKFDLYSLTIAIQVNFSINNNKNPLIDGERTYAQLSCSFSTKAAVRDDICNVEINSM